MNDERETLPVPGERADVRLEPVTQDDVRAVCDLRVAPAQESFVTANAISLAEAYVYPQAWCRAVYAADELVGFVMLHDTADEPGYMLWRLMIDARFQGRGLGRTVGSRSSTTCAPGPAPRS